MEGGNRSKRQAHAKLQSSLVLWQIHGLGFVSVKAVAEGEDSCQLCRSCRHVESHTHLHG